MLSGHYLTVMQLLMELSLSLRIENARKDLILLILFNIYSFTGAMIGLTILLGILSVLLIFVCCAYRHRLKKLLDPEQQSLLLS